MIGISNKTANFQNERKIKYTLKASKIELKFKTLSFASEIKESIYKSVPLNLIIFMCLNFKSYLKGKQNFKQISKQLN